MSVLDAHNLTIVVLLAIGFALAGFFGYLALRLKVSPILGYLVAGYLIGPFSPGFVGDMKGAEQLAEIGVILMMFGVGLNFKVQELIKVKNIAIPGALGQTIISAILGAVTVYSFGWSLTSGVILGLAIAVASTVVLFRMLAEHGILRTKEGHIAAGWLILEDIITVLILLFLPTLAEIVQGNAVSFLDVSLPLLIILGKFGILALLLFAFSRKLVSFVFDKVMATKSHELFTLAILALIFVIATGTTLFFGISIALGAFIAGMVVRRTKVHNLVFEHSLPMKDAFIVIFFLSAGMLFNPSVIWERFPLFISVLGIIFIAKPLIAFVITVLLKYPYKTALIISVALAQIGEFSFILCEEAMKFGLLPDEGYDIIVACALVSIALNPILFKWVHKKSHKQAR